MEGQVVYSDNGHPYDYAPGAVIMEAAGVRVETLGLDRYNYLDTRFVAASALAFEPLKQFMEAIQHSLRPYEV